MTDGAFDLALMVYDSEDVHEAQLSGSGPCIHHWGIQVQDRDASTRAIEAHGGAIISDPGEGALKFRAPDGAVAEIVRAGRYRKASGENRGRIQGLSIATPDSRQAAHFYRSVFGFEARPTGSVAQLTDGSFSLSLLQASSNRAAHDHWTVGVNDLADTAKALERHGGRRASGRPDFFYRIPDGSILQLVQAV